MPSFSSMMALCEALILSPVISITFTSISCPTLSTLSTLSILSSEICEICTNASRFGKISTIAPISNNLRTLAL